MEVRVLASISVAFVLMECYVAATYSSRLIHRFSSEMKAVRVSRKGDEGFSSWPRWRGLEFYGMIMRSDVEKQKMKLGPQHQFLFPSEGSKIMSFGNDFGWLHYTWIDVGMPSVSFLVALDAGSDLLWVPCDCVQCAPLSASYYSSLEKDLNEYNPSLSNTSKQLTCNHQSCELGSTCKNAQQPCPYTVNYLSENTSSSGFLVEDVLHLASTSADGSKIYLRAPVIIGCGRKQSGGYLDGVAPDGLMGLGIGDVSVPSYLAKAGVVRNSFSLCFDDDDSGRIFFGDQGLSTQQTTPFLLLDGKYVTYIVGVEACCIGSSCLDDTGFNALVDSGTSFTFLPTEVYQIVVDEFDGQVNATKTSFEGYPWEYCYKSSSQQTPSVILKFAVNSSLIIRDPVFVIYGTQGVAGFCLAVQPVDGEVGTIGQNFMTGYRMVFDRENLRLGWSRSNCQDLSDERMPLNNSSSNQLPTTEQQSTPRAHAVAPAVAGRTPSKSSASSLAWFSSLHCLPPWEYLLLLLLC